jgi:hypothetical protein
LKGLQDEIREKQLKIIHDSIDEANGWCYHGGKDGKYSLPCAKC